MVKDINNRGVGVKVGDLVKIVQPSKKGRSLPTFAMGIVLKTDRKRAFWEGYSPAAWIYWPQVDDYTWERYRSLEVL
jgi:hypothetical protein